MYRIERLTNHDRTRFSGGVDALDRYFREQALQDVRRRATSCFVAVDEANSTIGGYYTLSAGSVPLTTLPLDIVKRLPRYPSVPVARLGRLAVDTSAQGNKLGAALLWDAVKRSTASELMAFGLVVDAKDERAESFYLYHGFVVFALRQLLLPFSKLRTENML